MFAYRSLHRQITNELSDVLALTTGIKKSGNSLLVADLGIKELIRLSDHLIRAVNDYKVRSKDLQKAKKPLMYAFLFFFIIDFAKYQSIREQDDLVMLIKVAKSSSNSEQSLVIAKRAFFIFQSIRCFELEKDLLLNTRISLTYNFLKRVTKALVEVGQKNSSLDPIIRRLIWEQLLGLKKDISSSSTGEIWSEIIPSILGIIDSLEENLIWCLDSDIEYVSALATSFFDSKNLKLMNDQFIKVQKQSDRSRGKIALKIFAQNGWKPSGNILVVNFLKIEQTLLEFRLLESLIRAGAIDENLVKDKNSFQMRQSLKSCELKRDFSPDSSLAISKSLQKLYKISLNTFLEMRSIVISEDSGPANVNGSSVDSAQLIMKRCLVVATISGFLRGKLDEEYLLSVFGHIRSQQSFRTSSVTESCFEALSAAAKFFSHLRPAISRVLIDYILTPVSNDINMDLPDSTQKKLLFLSVKALTRCLYTEKDNIFQLASSMHEMTNGLLSDKIRDTKNISHLKRRISYAFTFISVIVKNSELCSLAVSMLLGPEFREKGAIMSTLVSCFGQIAMFGNSQTRLDVVAALLNVFSYQNISTNNKILFTVSKSLANLIRSIDEKETLISIFGIVMRSFIDSSNKFLEKRSDRHLPYFYYSSIIEAVAEKCFTSEPSAEMVSSWRQFWFLVIFIGLVDEKNEGVEYKSLRKLTRSTPLLVHRSTVNYFETEIEYSIPYKTQNEDAIATTKVRSKLQTIIPSLTNHIRYMGLAQMIFLLSVLFIESNKAKQGNACSILGYFMSPAILSSKLLTPLEIIFRYTTSLYIIIYKSENTSYANDNLPSSVMGSNEENLDSKLQMLCYDQNIQIQQLMVLSCHHSSNVSENGSYAVNEVLTSNPSSLLVKETINTLLELLQLVWLSCRSESDDKFVPVYLFSSPILKLVMQFPDSMTRRRDLFNNFSSNALKWLERTGSNSPIELQTLLYNYLTISERGSEGSFGFEPHVGRSLALQVGRNLNPATSFGLNDMSYFDKEDLKFGAGVSELGLSDNASSFLYKYGEQCFINGRNYDSDSIYHIKAKLSEIYKISKSGKSVSFSSSELSRISSLLAIAGSVLVRKKALDMELVRLLAWVPVTIFQSSLMQQAIYVWTNIVVERPDVELVIIIELSIAWHWIIQNNHGVFTQLFEPKNPFDSRMSYVPSDKSARSKAYNSMSKELMPQRLLVTFLLHRLDASWSRPANNRSIADTMIRILQLTFENVDRMSTAALSRYERFQLVYMGLKVLRWRFPDWVSEARFREKLFQLAFSWFFTLPKWSFSGNKSLLAIEITLLIDTHSELQKYKLILPNSNSNSGSDRDSFYGKSENENLGSKTSILGSYSPFSSTAETKSPVTQPSKPFGHSRNMSVATIDSSAVPIQFISQMEVRFKRNQALLLLLLESEIRRLVIWANPSGDIAPIFSSASRFSAEPPLSNDGWRNLVRDAWIADPKLAIYLSKRFPHPSVEDELRSLVRAFPGELVLEGESLPLLIYETGSTENLAPPPTSIHNVNDIANEFKSLKSTKSIQNTLLRMSAKKNSIFSSTHGTLPQLNSEEQISAKFHEEALRVASLMSEISDMKSVKTFRELKFLLYYAPVPPVSAIRIISSDLVRESLILMYAMRAIEHFPVDVVFFNIPQLVQALRYDDQGYVERAIVEASKISQLFAHQIIWNVKANEYHDEDGKVPDLQLKPKLDRIQKRIISDLSGKDKIFYEKEFSFFNKVTAISGSLKPYVKKSKSEKKRKIDEEMRKIKVEMGVYLPSNPNGKVVGIDYDSGRPLQSHAKAPFMATFYIIPEKEVDDDIQELVGGGQSSSSSVSINKNYNKIAYIDENSGKLESHENDSSGDVLTEPQSSLGPMINISATKSNTLAESVPDPLIGLDSVKLNDDDQGLKNTSLNNQAFIAFDESLNFQPEGLALHLPQQTPEVDSKNKVLSKSKSDDKNTPSEKTRLSAIFKVGDDCRQDMLALQMIAIFKNIFASCGLDLYLFPYRVVSTAPGCGVIEVIPNSMSRDQMGREKVNSLYDYFLIKYGGVDSVQFQQARSNFVQSCAAYSVLSYLLLFKDRHNGNIMIDESGHLIHIDFGFILGIAPGGITFESAPFKLTTEYIQVMGGSQTAQSFKLFCDLCVKAYLACRPYAHEIIQTASIMADSGLPCFAKADVLNRLKERFQLDLSEKSAAEFMMARIYESYENRRTVLYDSFQKATNGIPY
ncbi:Phosphatidylinositol 4-kinase stt4 [Smittium mucronatum]|uniref:1-phosphatidylinositol 4-kinase n=1 Tax=Smittium mucronatum TaxID=133383 RepID=A0A1R0H9F6_9FUNG|nr:Phosphatidylinositol 4-kinase stt4 [Smittium mucronatum]